jgi:potassium-dependent mechanosensitive channel
MPRRPPLRSTVSQLPSKLWNKSAAAGCGDCRPWKAAAFRSVIQLEKGHGVLSPGIARAVAAVFVIVALAGEPTLALAAPAALPAEGPPATPEANAKDEAETGLSIETVRKRLDALVEDTTLADEVRGRAREKFEKALAALKQEAADRSEIARLKQAAASAAVREEGAKQAVAKPAEIELPAVNASATIAENEASRQEGAAKLAAMTTQLQEVKAAITDRRKESKALPQQIAELENKLAELQKPVVEDTEVDPALARSQAASREAAIREISTGLELARQKVRTFEAEATLLPLEEQVLQRGIATATERVEALTKISAAKRQDLIESRQSEFELELGEVSTERQRESAGTIALLEKWGEIATRGRQFAAELVETRDQAASIQADFRETESLVASDLETGGALSPSVGFLLVRTRGLLPGDGQIVERARRQAGIIEDTQAILAVISARIDELDKRMPVHNDPDPAPDIDRLEYALLQTMDRDAERFLIETLIPLGVQQKTLRTVARDYRQLINSHLLWVRSDRPLDLRDLEETAAGLASLMQPGRGRQLTDDMAAAVLAKPLAVIVGLVSIVVLGLLHRWFVRQIIRLGGVVAGRNGLRLGPTLSALGMTVMAAIPVWLGTWLVAQLLSGITAADSLGGSFAGALTTVAAVLLPLEFLRQLLRPHGVASVHFGWPAKVTGPLRQAARRAVAGALPLLFLWQLLDLESGSVDEVKAAARLAFMLLMAVVVGILWMLARPTTGFISTLAADWGGPAAVRLSWLWRGFAVAVPLGLAALMGLGYGYSAVQLAESLLRSVWLVILAMVVHGVALRWLLISRRRIAMNQLRQRAVERARAEAIPQEASVGPPIYDDTNLDITAINQQTKRLIDATLFVGLLAGLYWIWLPVLPALGFLDRVSLWQQRAADGSVTGAVTLANLLLSVPIVVLTFIVVRNAPGLLEAAVLRHLPLDSPSRYAITTLASYLIAGVGLVLAAATLGLSWGGVQWLVAGLSVGLGFGLQEVVANFICGIILLFEQPIRVGDVVTLDGVTGVVSRIRIRATTVTTWERQEYIVPNKDLITGRVTNWTLSDTTNRVEVRVGVAYGTDTRGACSLLRAICTANEEVLDDPAPLISFEEFGNSALTLVLRFYLASLDRRLSVVSDIHTAIHEQFATAGIEIAFPQVDVHFPGQSSEETKKA